MQIVKGYEVEQTRVVLTMIYEGICGVIYLNAMKFEIIFNKLN